MSKQLVSRDNSKTKREVNTNDMSNANDTGGPMDAGYTPIKVSDIASMMRKQIPPNERPYTKTVLKSNNRLVDEWEEKVLKKICGSSGCIMAGQVFAEWNYFYTGKTIKMFINGLKEGIITRPDETAVNYWVNAFTNRSVKQLTDMGTPIVGYGWKIIIDETFVRGQLSKWEKVYSQSDDPLEWRKLANDNPKLWNMDGESPFWGPDDFSTISEKVLTFLKTPISPSQ